jgi:hypothetical protein
MKFITLALLLVLFTHVPTLCQKPQTVSVQGKAYATHYGGKLFLVTIALPEYG